jgi:hypothetical protein
MCLRPYFVKSYLWFFTNEFENGPLKLMADLLEADQDEFATLGDVWAVFAKYGQ